MDLSVGAKQPPLVGLGYGEESPESVKTNIDTYFSPLLKTVKSPQRCTNYPTVEKKYITVTVLLNAPFKLPYLIFRPNV